METKKIIKIKLGETKINLPVNNAGAITFREIIPFGSKAIIPFLEDEFKQVLPARFKIIKSGDIIDLEKFCCLGSFPSPNYRQDLTIYELYVRGKLSAIQAKSTKNDPKRTIVLCKKESTKRETVPELTLLYIGSESFNL